MPVNKGLRLLVVVLSWHWLAAAAAQGYVEGREAYVARDFLAAEAIWRAAAEAGDMRAEFALGSLYERGQGVESNPFLAAFWYRRAADQGYAPAQFNLGNAYLHGRGVPQDDGEAVFWWLRAAEQDFASAQFNLANHYYRGRGIEQDLERAVEWYQKAANNGHQRAQQTLQSLGIEMATPSLAQTGAPPETHLEPVPEQQSTKPAGQQSSAPAVAEVAPPVAPAERMTEVALPQTARPTTKAAQPSNPPALEWPLPSPPSIRPKPRPAAGLRDGQWLLQQVPSHYTVQLAAMSDKQGVERFIRRHGLQGALAYYSYQRDGKTLYGLVFGHYESMAAARADIAQLPASLRENPWIRRIGAIQSLIQQP